MVLALYVVAGVMVAGGLMAIYSGSDIIVMERGWTRVICGSVMAASGALLAGIATAVARLQSLAGDFARLSERLAPPGTTAFAAPPEMAPAAAPRPQRRSVPPAAAMPDLTGYRDLDVTPEPILARPPAEPPRVEPPRAEPPRVEPPRAEPPRFELPAAAAADLNDELFDGPGADAPAPEPLDALPEPEEEAPPTVVGTYNSGGNFYIMYSDGSIEAETPAGKFRFTSLDELKDFIAAGGDKPKTAAPV